MALFKISKGAKSNLPSTLTEGFCWYTYDDSKFYIDYKDENGSLVRKALNAEDAETLSGASLATILNSSDVEIPTSKAVFDAIASLSANAVIEWGSIGDLAGGGLEGNGSEFYALAPSSLTFKSPEPLNEFKEVTINGEVVDSSNYTLEEGSTIVNLSIDYLKTLSNGSYNISIVSENKTINGNFTIKVPPLNEYGFYYNQPYSIYGENENGETAYLTFLFTPVTDTLEGHGMIKQFDYEAMDFIMVGFYNVVDNMIVVYDSYPDGDVILAFTIEQDGLHMEDYIAAPAANMIMLCDDFYMYLYNEEIEGYIVYAIDPLATTSYGPVKSNIHDYPIKMIGNNAFYGAGEVNADMTNFTIPDTVIIIGENAFGACDLPLNFSIPNDVFLIGAGAFQDSFANLKNIKVPNGVERIEEKTFFSTESIDYLNTITIPASVNYIGRYGISAKTIIYEGTIAEWNSIEKDPEYIHEYQIGVLVPVVQCTDGSISLNS